MVLSCDVGPFRAIESAQVGGDQSFTLPSGLQLATVAVRGTAGPPKVTLEGPGGERVVTPPEPDGRVLDERFLLFQNPDERTTHVAINRPAAGNWRVTADPGTIESVQVANGLPQPSVKATVSGSGHSRKLTYSVKQIVGQSVHFEEVGNGSAAGSDGRVQARSDPLHPRRRAEGQAPHRCPGRVVREPAREHRRGDLQRPGSGQAGAAGRREAAPQGVARPSPGGPPAAPRATSCARRSPTGAGCSCSRPRRSAPSAFRAWRAARAGRSRSRA